jgi:hypothetical protein
VGQGIDDQGEEIMSGNNDREPEPANKAEGLRRRTLLLRTTSLVAASGITAIRTVREPRPPRFDDLMLDRGDDYGRLVWARINPLIHPVSQRVLAA